MIERKRSNLSKEKEEEKNEKVKKQKEKEYSFCYRRIKKNLLFMKFSPRRRKKKILHELTFQNHEFQLFRKVRWCSLAVFKPLFLKNVSYQSQTHLFISNKNLFVTRTTSKLLI